MQECRAARPIAAAWTWRQGWQSFSEVPQEVGKTTKPLQD